MSLCGTKSGILVTVGRKLPSVLPLGAAINARKRPDWLRDTGIIVNTLFKLLFKWFLIGFRNCSGILVFMIGLRNLVENKKGVIKFQPFASLA